MIRAYFGLKQNPFSQENIQLLPHQEEIFEILKVHSQQGGLCLLLGEPGTGKSVIKDIIMKSSDKRSVVASVGRTLHTYWNTIQILCEAFSIELEPSPFKCEKKLITEALSLYREGKSLITIIDEAHLLELHTLRKLRLMFDEFPKNHNLILIGQPSLLYQMSLKVHQDIKSRVTYSVVLQKLNPDDITQFIFGQLDQMGIGHNLFSPDALHLLVKSSEGVLRRVRNLCLSCMLEAVRKQTKEITLDIVNSILMQPHWRNDYDLVQT